MLVFATLRVREDVPLERFVDDGALIVRVGTLLKIWFEKGDDDEKNETDTLGQLMERSRVFGFEVQNGAQQRRHKL